MRHRQVRNRFLQRYAVPEFALRSGHEFPERGLVFLLDHPEPCLLADAVKLDRTRVVHERGVVAPDVSRIVARRQSMAGTDCT